MLCTTKASSWAALENGENGKCKLTAPPGSNPFCSYRASNWVVTNGFAHKLLIAEVFRSQRG
eukprot:5035719-Amphidinium_carterae.1